MNYVPMVPSDSASSRSVRSSTWVSAVILAAAATFGLRLQGAEEAPAKITIPVVRPSSNHPVDFDRQILPILKANCLACHNRTTSKGDLLLETPADILKGGESGPAAIAGKAAESLAFKMASHETKPRMPPRENKVNARDMTPEELGLIATWIDQGARASERRTEKIEWQSLAPQFNPIYAVAISADGNYAACGRANRVDVYHVSSGRLLGRLADPELSGVSHRDVVNSIAFNGDGTRLASGGYREAKIWRRPVSVVVGTNGITVGSPAPQKLLNEVTKRQLILTNEVATLQQSDDLKPIATLKGEQSASLRSKAAARSLAIATNSAEFRRTTLDAAMKEQQASHERLKKAIEADAAALKVQTEKEAAALKPRRAKFEAEMEIARADRQAGTSTNTTPTELQKKAKERLDAAVKALEAPENEARSARLKASTARNELELSRQAIHRGETQILAARAALRDAKSAVAQSEAETEAAKKALASTENPIKAIALSPNGKLAATVDGTSLIQLWETGTGTALESLKAPGNPVDFLTFAGDRHLIFGGGSEQRAWDLYPDWTLERTLGTGDPNSPIVDRVNVLTFRADGARLAGGSGEPSRGSEIRVWDTATGTQLYAVTNLHSDSVLALAFSPDGAWLASGGADRFARVLDLGTAKPVRAFEGHTGHVLGVAWAPHGRTLATAGADNIVKFWNVTTGERRKQGGGFTKEVGAVAYVSNDQVLAVSGDPTVRVLNENADKVRDLEGARDFQASAAVSTDGSIIVSGGLDGVLRVWRGVENKLSIEFAPPQEGWNSSAASKP